jgi:hypothetical protein
MSALVAFIVGVLFGAFGLIVIALAMSNGKDDE